MGQNKSKSAYQIVLRPKKVSPSPSQTQLAQTRSMPEKKWPDPALCEGFYCVVQPMHFPYIFYDFVNFACLIKRKVQAIYTMDKNVQNSTTKLRLLLIFFRRKLWIFFFYFLQIMIKSILHLNSCKIVLWSLISFYVKKCAN